MTDATQPAAEAAQNTPDTGATKPAAEAAQNTPDTGVTKSGDVLVGGTGAAEDNPAKAATEATPTREKGTGETDGGKAAKTDGGKAVEGAEKAAGDDDTVPADGKYVIKQSAEGVPVDEAMLEAFGPRAVELGITQKQAQGLADFLTEYRQVEYDKAVEAYAQEVRGWKKAVEDDEQLGRGNLKETVRFGNAAVQKFGDDEFRSLLQDNGLGNHPGVVRFLSRVGRALADDTFEAGVRAEPETRVEDRWYPTAKP